MNYGETTAALSATRVGGKIDRLGLGTMIIEMLSINTPITEIVRQCNKFLEEEMVKSGGDVKDAQQISRPLLEAWVHSRGEKIQKYIMEEQFNILREEVWHFERQGIKIRQEISDKISMMLNGELTEEKIKDMSIEDKKMVTSMLMKILEVQESGERFIGIGSREGKRFKVDINVNVDLIDRMRSLVKKQAKDKIKKVKVIDAEYKDNSQ